MSLHHAAQHLKAQGRGPDDQLIHMSGKEVAGLQALAKAHGGSLTVNPTTGLPEAGFLDSILPTVIGAGAMFFAPELGLAGLTAGQVGMGVGALQTLRTGDLGKGLMAGLGAYGGAGLMGAAGEAGMLKGAEVAPTGGTVPAAPNVAAPTGITPGVNATDDLLLRNQSNLIGADLEQMPANMPTANALKTPIAQPTPTFGDLIMQNKGYAAAAAGPAVLDAMSPTRTPPKGTEQMIRPYEFAYNKQTPTNMIGTTRQPGQDTSERLWFQPQYTALTPYKAAEGGLLSLAAGGGPVERMSNANAVGANTQYPGADINQGAYATPWQTPISRNVVTGPADTGVNPVTGEENRYAAGGVTGSGNLDLHIPLDLGGGQGGFGGGANGYQGVGAGGGQGGSLGQMRPMPAVAPQNPFEGDANWKNYQSQMSGMVNDFKSSDQYKNFMSLQDTMKNYAAQRMSQMGNSGLYGGQPPRQTYEQYLAGRNPMQQDVQMTREQFENQGTGTNSPVSAFAQGGVSYAGGGISNLGSYSDGGRLLKGPGDGMSDNIPAQIGAKQPARLADGEFVVPADVVSHLGNGSTDAGAKQLYKMMDRIRTQRTGKKKQAPEVNPTKAMPA